MLIIYVPLSEMMSFLEGSDLGFHGHILWKIILCKCSVHLCCTAVQTFLRKKYTQKKDTKNTDTAIDGQLTRNR